MLFKAGARLRGTNWKHSLNIYTRGVFMLSRSDADKKFPTRSRIQITKTKEFQAQFQVCRSCHPSLNVFRV